MASGEPESKTLTAVLSLKNAGSITNEEADALNRIYVDLKVTLLG
jgi:hypothetical protein